jgi:hypothetical protein
MKNVMVWNLILLLGLVVSIPSWAAAEKETGQSAIVGTWQGTLPNGMGGQIRIVLKVVEKEGALSATLDSPDQNASDIPVSKISVEQDKVQLEVSAVGGSYEGTLNPAKSEISGKWQQNGQSMDLLFKKETGKK